MLSMPAITESLAARLSGPIDFLSYHLDEMERSAAAGNHAQAMKHSYNLIVNGQGILDMCPQRQKIYDTFNASVEHLRRSRVKSFIYGLDRLCEDVDAATQKYAAQLKEQMAHTPLFGLEN